MPVFDIDENLTVWRNLPVRLRQAVMFAWLKTLTAPVRWLQGVFNANRAANLYVLAHDGQVCYLEAVLNDTFDPIARGIFISDPVWIDPIYDYLAVEDKLVYSDLASEVGTSVIPAPDPLPGYLASELFTGSLSGSFVVHVPSAVTFDSDRMRAVLNFYRLPTKSYTIVIF